MWNTSSFCLNKLQEKKKKKKKQKEIGSLTWNLNYFSEQYLIFQHQMWGEEVCKSELGDEVFFMFTVK